MIPVTTTDNFEQHLYDYAVAVYGDDVEPSRSQCPYNLNDYNEEHAIKQFFVWFIFLRTNPRTGMTILEEFTRRFVKDARLAGMLLRARGAFYDEFTIISKVTADVTTTGKRQRGANNGIITARNSAGRNYRIMVTRKTFVSYDAGAKFFGIIHPWLEDGTHKTCGILIMALPPHMAPTVPRFGEGQNVMPALDPDTVGRLLRMGQKMDARAKKSAESIPVGRGQTLASILTNLTLKWVDGISTTLKISTAKMIKAEKIDAISSFLTSERLRGVIYGLSKKEMDCLVHVTDAGGIIRYAALQKHFGKDDAAELWKSWMPTSTIGHLRKRGLLVVGVLERGSKYRHVVVPEDVLACMHSLWPDWPQDITRMPLRDESLHAEEI